MPVIVIGQSLRPVKVTGEQATDHADPNDASRTILGTPVAFTGTNVKRFQNVSDLVTETIRAESDPAKRLALLTNVKGRVIKSGRLSIKRDVMAALTAGYLATVTDDPENATNADRRAAGALMQSDFDAGLVILPDTDTDDTLAFMFGYADTEDDTDTDTEPVKAPPLTTPTK